MYELKLRKYNYNGELKENPYKKNFKEGQLSYIQGMLMRETETGYDDKNKDIPFYYLKFVEVGGIELAEAEEKYRKIKIRTTKGIIKELLSKEIEVKKIVPLFDKDSEDLTELLLCRVVKYVPGETKKINQEEDIEGNIFYEIDQEETFNYLVEIRRWDKLTNRPIRETYVVREVQDLLKIK